MTLRRMLFSVVTATLICAPAVAGQPDRYALEMLSNPAVIGIIAGDPNGLPAPVTGGFQLIQEFAPRSLTAGDTIRLDLALVPFRSGGAVLRLRGATEGPPLLALRFADGLVDGVPYQRSGWNDVRVELHVATQDYDLTVNGMHAGPFPLSAECAAAGGCTVVSALSVEGRVFEATTGWLDSVTLDRLGGDGGEVLVQMTFDSLEDLRVRGGTLVLEPPKNLRPSSVASPVGALPRLERRAD
jgi:hypothetical protein